jgi:hypothetical protein
MSLITRIRGDRNLALMSLKHECIYIQKVSSDVIQEYACMEMISDD